MAIVIGLALGLIIAGIILVKFGGGIGLLSTVLYYTGIIIIIVGLILLVTPVLNWVYMQLKMMLAN